MKNSVSFKSELSKFGMGLFETIKIENSIPIELDLHLDRMYNSIEELNLNISEDKYDLKSKILSYIDENNIVYKALRVTVFDEGYNISTRDIVYNKEMYNKGLKLMLSTNKRGDSILYKHKTTNYFENIYIKRYALENGFDDAIFLDYENRILECSISNIFFIKNNQIYTPNKDLSILNGIMKKRIIRLCGELKINIVETDIKITDLKNFEFCFVSNSLMGIMKVEKINDIKFKQNNDIFNELWSRIIK
ncbi:aminotransferase class IV [Paraclostridium bifermentans]|uniref:aminotransferase class IV n=1 Tax=Paraclostridium bifermentans TaxID=1490 RepID=UPI00359CA3CA